MKEEVPPRPKSPTPTAPPPPPPPPCKSRKKRRRLRQFSLNLTQEQYEFIKSVADETGQHMSEVIRGFITQAMMTKNVTDNPGLLSRLLGMFRKRSITTITEEEWMVAATRKQSKKTEPPVTSERMKAQLEMMNELKEVLKKRRERQQGDVESDDVRV